LWAAGAIEFADQIGMERIEKRHRQWRIIWLAEMEKRGATSWTSPDAALRCGIATVNVPPVKRMELGKLAMERKENPHPRRRAIEATDFYAVLCAAQGCGSFSRCV